MNKIVQKIFMDTQDKQIIECKYEQIVL